MKKTCIFVYLLLLMGCATTIVPPRPFVDQAIWSHKNNDEVYSACLTALQMEGFDIHPLGTSKESGLIVTGKISFYPFENFYLIKGYYILQILISELQKNKIMVNVRVKASWKKIDPQAWGYNVDDLHNRINNRISDDLKRLFTRLDILLGKAEYYRGDRVLVWE